MCRIAIWCRMNESMTRPRRQAIMNRIRLPIASILTFMLLCIAAVGAAPSVIASPPPDSQPVYALPGTLQRAEGQSFLTYFVTLDGNKYAIYGETPEVDAEIDALKRNARRYCKDLGRTLSPRDNNIPDLK